MSNPRVFHYLTGHQLIARSYSTPRLTSFDALSGRYHRVFNTTLLLAVRTRYQASSPTARLIEREVCRRRSAYYCQILGRNFPLNQGFEAPAIPRISPYQFWEKIIIEPIITTLQDSKQFTYTLPPCTIRLEFSVATAKDHQSLVLVSLNAATES